MHIRHAHPNNVQATIFHRKRVNLVCTLPNITEKAFNGIGSANGTMYHGSK